jgi:hypothetical protein
MKQKRRAGRQSHSFNHWIRNASNDTMALDVAQFGVCRSHSFLALPAFSSHFLLLIGLRAFDAVFTGADKDENNQNAEHFD